MLKHIINIRVGLLTLSNSPFLVHAVIIKLIKRCDGGIREVKMEKEILEKEGLA